jgi:itaconate CoA-transferase
MKPLDGVLVVALEQAVAAPTCSVKLADLGARIIKIEREEGDFARGYDDTAKGQSSYFVWLNRGKESLKLDLTKAEDKALLGRLLAKADIFLQNLKPGAVEKLGFGIESLREKHPSLICCSISGYGDSGPYRDRKAYDLLIQAEGGLASLTGSADAPSRVGVSIVDIATGMNAYEAILAAFIRRLRTGEGADLRISMFDGVADLCTVPLLQHEGGKSPKRPGLAHPSIAPYGVFKSRDAKDILIAVQSDREWVLLARDVFGDAALAEDGRLTTNVLRVNNRALTDTRIGAHFAARDGAALEEVFAKKGIAFARVSTMDDLSHHPHLRRIVAQTPNGPVSMPAPAMIMDGVTPEGGRVPALNEHGAAIRAEFSA